MSILTIHQRLKYDPNNRMLRARIAAWILLRIEDLSSNLLRSSDDELREEIKSAGFAAAWDSLDDLLDDYADTEDYMLNRIDDLARPAMELARDSKYKPCGIGRDSRHIKRVESEQNKREQAAGCKQERKHSKSGERFEFRECLNGETDSEYSDDIEDKRDRQRELQAFRLWIEDEVNRMIATEPIWLRKAIELATTDSRFGVGKARNPSISAIAKAVGVDRRKLDKALWRVGCLIAVNCPDFVVSNGLLIMPDEIGRREIPREWEKAVREGEKLLAESPLLNLLFRDAA
jgi:hypothetical protein